MTHGHLRFAALTTKLCRDRWQTADLVQAPRSRGPADLGKAVRHTIRGVPVLKTVSILLGLLRLQPPFGAQFAELMKLGECSQDRPAFLRSAEELEGEPPVCDRTDVFQTKGRRTP